MDFTVVVTKDGKKGLVVDCSSFNQELSVNYLTVSEDAMSFAKESRHFRGSS